MPPYFHGVLTFKIIQNLTDHFFLHRVMALNSHKSEKKKKRYKDSLSLAAMIRKFQKEKDALKKESNPKTPVNFSASSMNNPHSAAVALGNDVSDLNLNSADPDLPIFVSTNEHELFQEAENALEMLDDLDFDRLLDAASNGSPLSESGGENGNTTQPTYASQVMPKVVPTLPEGLPVLLEKRIEDLRVVSVIILLFFVWCINIAINTYFQAKIITYNSNIHLSNFISYISF